jgi:sugar phosphate isomerase/epimerase
MYFQEHSEGIRAKVAKEIEMQQMPGFGGALDYRPIVKALREIGYRGLVEIFMHPTPRGVPILPSVGEISAAVNKSRRYIEDCLAQTAC